ncbi:type II toxin-antitoxin system PemK/MazF family toxin [Candidatus Pacearchaeota archaeon]|nr:type II toxin-antitoxin system PemK/MazF family toxin [Candidatus Pacearchaeota archaeon]
MNRGEICLLSFPYIPGREQIGKRPAIVLADTKTGLIIIIPLTTNLETLKYPYTLKIKSSQKNKLENDSVALIFQLRAIDKRRIIHKIGDLEESILKEIDNLLRNLLKL